MHVTRVAGPRVAPGQSPGAGRAFRAAEILFIDGKHPYRAPAQKIISVSLTACVRAVSLILACHSWRSRLPAPIAGTCPIRCLFANHCGFPSNREMGPRRLRAITTITVWPTGTKPNLMPSSPNLPVERRGWVGQPSGKQRNEDRCSGEASLFETRPPGWCLCL